jgi:hypothetical protein
VGVKWWHGTPHRCVRIRASLIGGRLEGGDVVRGAVVAPRTIPLSFVER